jgi:hypothetical protein
MIRPRSLNGPLLGRVEVCFREKTPKGRRSFWPGEAVERECDAAREGFGTALGLP